MKPIIEVNLAKVSVKLNGFSKVNFNCDDVKGLF